MQVEGAGTSSTSGEEVAQGSLSSSRAARNRDTPSSKIEPSVGLMRNYVLAKTRGGDPLETESYLSQVKGKDVLDKSQPSVSSNSNNMSTDSIPGGKGGLYGPVDVVLTGCRFLFCDQRPHFFNLPTKPQKCSK